MSTENEAALQAASEFGLTGPRILAGRLPEAWSNHVVPVEAAQGRFAIKVFPAGVSLDRLHRGMAIEAAVLAADEVLLPEPVADAAGRWLVRTHSGRFARAHAWLDGTAASAVEPTAELVRDVGSSVGAIRSLGLPAGTTADLEPFRIDRWPAAVERAGSLGTPWCEDLSALTPLVQELAREHERLRGLRRPMFAGHGDLDPKNAVIRADGRVALTDWDYAGPVLPSAELVVAATSFARGHEPLVTAFAEAYRERAGSDTLDTDTLDADTLDADTLDADTLDADALDADPLGVAILALADIDWLIDLVERLDPDDCETPPEPLVGFAGRVERLRAWTERLDRL